VFSGIFTSLITPYNNGQNRHIDTITLTRLAADQLAKGVSGFLVSGHTGEGLLLNSDEKTSVIQSVKTAIKSTGLQKILIADCTAYSTGTAVKNTANAIIAGADAVLVKPPSCPTCPDRAVFDHFVTVANQSQLPVIICNDPKQTGLNLNFADVLRLGEHNNIKAYCEAGDSLHTIEKLKAELSSKIAIMSSNDISALPMLLAGAEGVISSSSNAVLKNWITLFNNFKDNNFIAAQKNQSELLGLHEALTIEPGPGAVKAVLNLAGLTASDVRQPFIQPMRPVLYRLAAELDKLGIPINNGELS
jgi:4-hydroxy-tetrahydrodipicolinate synthase